MSQLSVAKLCGVLIAVHLVADLFSAWFVDHSRTTPANLAFAMLIGGQLSVLAIGAGLAWRRELRRTLVCAGGLIAGTAWIWALLLTTTQTWHRERIREYAASACITVVATAIGLTLAMRPAVVLPSIRSFGGLLCAGPNRRYHAQTLVISGNLAMLQKSRRVPLEVSTNRRFSEVST